MNFVFPAAAARWPYRFARLQLSMVLSIVLPMLLIMGCSGAAGLPGVDSVKSPAGSASAQPHLARGPAGKVVLSWLEARSDSHELRFATLEGRGWSSAESVTNGSHWFANWADFPAVQPIDEQFWVAHWLVRKAGSAYAYDTFVATSTDAGKQWGEPLRLHSDDSATEHGFVSIYPDGEAAEAVWLDGRNMLNDTGSLKNRGMTLRSASISTTGSISQEVLVDSLVCDCCQTDAANGPDGPLVVYRNRTENEIRDIYLARKAHDKWQEVVRVATDDWLITGCPVNGPAIAAQGAEVVVAWYTAANETPLVRLARSTDGGDSFAPAIDVATEEPLGRVDVVALSGGGSAVSWMSRSEDGWASLNVRRVGAEGELSSIIQVARMAPNRPSGFPQMVRSEDRLVFAWTDVSGVEPVVRTAFVDLGPLLER